LNKLGNTSDMTEKIRRASQQGDREFYELDPQAVNNRLIHAVKEKQITVQDRAHITAFANEIVASNNVGKSRHFKIVSILVNWRRYIGPCLSPQINPRVLLINASRKSVQSLFSIYKRAMKKHVGVEEDAGKKL
jgi:hypothetical protein